MSSGNDGSRCQSFLSNDDFEQVIVNTPLVSIDLVVYQEDKVLLGKRVNRPARDFWFVPGGRIRKNESIAVAFSRICHSELGLGISLSCATFLGPFDHFYTDSVFGESISTHYVVLAYRLNLVERLDQLPKLQHSEFLWWLPEEAMKSQYVHSYSKKYLEISYH